jgi:hypothetical protein
MTPYLLGKFKDASLAPPTPAELEQLRAFLYPNSLDRIFWEEVFPGHPVERCTRLTEVFTTTFNLKRPADFRRLNPLTMRLVRASSLQGRGPV